MSFTQLTKHCCFALVLLMSGLDISAFAATVSQKPIQSRESIRETARAYAEQLANQQGSSQKINIEVGSLDKRLKLAKCSQPLQAFESPNTKNVGRTTIGVRCNGDKPWKLYVSVNIQILKNVVTLKQPVTRNSILTNADLAIRELDIASLHRGYFTSLNAVTGKHVKNAMRSGTILSPSHLKNPKAIKKGALVTIMAQVGGIQVRMKGKAMKSGALGDWISVKNLSSNRQIEGRITDSGVIEVTL